MSSCLERDERFTAPLLHLPCQPWATCHYCFCSQLLIRRQCTIRNRFAYALHFLPYACTVVSLKSPTHHTANIHARTCTYVLAIHYHGNMVFTPQYILRKRQVLWCEYFIIRYRKGLQVSCIRIMQSLQSGKRIHGV